MRLAADSRTGVSAMHICTALWHRARAFAGARLLRASASQPVPVQAKARVKQPARYKRVLACAVQSLFAAHAARRPSSQLAPAHTALGRMLRRIARFLAALLARLRQGRVQRATLACRAGAPAALRACPRLARCTRVRHACCKLNKAPPTFA